MSLLTPTLLLLLATAALASPASEWVKYKLKYGKVYSDEEDTTRMKIWMKNVAIVEKHNSEKHNYTMGINKFSDWTEEEINKLLGFLPIGERSNPNIFENLKTPDKVDFREDNLVTDQCICGSFCAAAGAIEGVWAKNTGQLVPLSVQQLVDCVTGTDYFNAWDHVIQVGGIQSEESYTGTDGSCHEDPTKFVTHINAYQCINPNEDQIESALVDLGHPISIAVHADNNWQHYIGGVMDNYDCGAGSLNHAVLLVGYDKTGPQPFWIVKNYWGSDWGENGYIRIKMGVNSCGLKNFPCYPTIDTVSTTTISSSTSTTLPVLTRTSLNFE